MILKRDDVFKVVCQFRTSVEDKIFFGTGIFMTTNGSDAWIVTAAHVAKDTNGTTQIVLSNDLCNCERVLFTDFAPSLSWIYHSVADIAVTKVTITEQNKKYLVNRCLPYDHFNLEENSVSRDCELTSVGFPHGLGAAGKFSPLTFRSYASSALISFPRFDTKTLSDFFCLENPSVGGYSGCPVFDLGYMVVGAMTTTKEKTICYGIMHGTMVDDTGGKLAVVTPTYYLKDIVV